jgi:peptidyl-tRNA hydrolase
MGAPTEVAAIRKILKERIKPEADKATLRHGKLLPKMKAITKGLDEAIANSNPEEMELYEQAFHAAETKVASLLTDTEALMAALDKLAESPDFIEELGTVRALTDQLELVRGKSRGWLTRTREKVAEMQQDKRGYRTVRADVAEQWAKATAQVTKAAKDAADAARQLKDLSQKAAKAIKDGHPNVLAKAQQEAKDFDTRLGEVTLANVGQLLARVNVATSKSELSKEQIALYDKDAKALSAKLDQALKDSVEAARVQGSIATMTMAGSTALQRAISEALKVSSKDAQRINKVAQDDPGKLLKELESTLKNLKLDLAAKEAYAMLKRIGVV